MQELHDHLLQQQVLYYDSIVGYQALRGRINERQRAIMATLGDHECATTAFQDTCHISYSTISDAAFQPISMLPAMTQGEIKVRLGDDGRNALLLANQIVVTSYTFWEFHLRFEIGKAQGHLKMDATRNDETKKILSTTVTDNFWGEMNCLRTCIVHHNGIANKDVSRCKLLSGYEDGKPLNINLRRMQQVFSRMADYLTKLNSLSRPKQTFHIPVGD